MNFMFDCAVIHVFRLEFFIMFLSMLLRELAPSGENLNRFYLVSGFPC